jgi:hypothetical protein
VGPQSNIREARADIFEYRDDLSRSNNKRLSTLREALPEFMNRRGDPPSVTRAHIGRVPDIRLKNIEGENRASGSRQSKRAVIRHS